MPCFEVFGTLSVVGAKFNSRLGVCGVATARDATMMMHAWYSLGDQDLFDEPLSYLYEARECTGRKCPMHRGLCDRVTSAAIFCIPVE